MRRRGGQASVGRGPGGRPPPGSRGGCGRRRLLGAGERRERTAWGVTWVTCARLRIRIAFARNTKKCGLSKSEVPLYHEDFRAPSRKPTRKRRMSPHPPIRYLRIELLYLKPSELQLVFTANYVRCTIMCAHNCAAFTLGYLREAGGRRAMLTLYLPTMIARRAGSAGPYWLCRRRSLSLAPTLRK